MIDNMESWLEDNAEIIAEAYGITDRLIPVGVEPLYNAGNYYTDFTRGYDYDYDTGRCKPDEASLYILLSDEQYKQLNELLTKQYHIVIEPFEKITDTWDGCEIQTTDDAIVFKIFSF